MAWDIVDEEVPIRIGGGLPSLISRYLTRLDQVVNAHYLLQNPVVETGQFTWLLKFSAGSVSASNNLIMIGKVLIRISSDTAITVWTSVSGASSSFTVPSLGSSLHSLSVTFNATSNAVTLSLDGVTIGTNNVGLVPDLVGNATIGAFNANTFNGYIADVDLGNGNAWSLGESTSNTEQAVNGNNLLTRINVTQSNVGLFTRNDAVTPVRWVGVELWTAGDISAVAATGGFVGGASTPVTVGNSYGFNFEIESYVSGACKAYIGNSGANRNSNGVYTDDVIASTNSAAIIVTSSPTTLDVINMSVKQYIEVAP